MAEFREGDPHTLLSMHSGTLLRFARLLNSGQGGGSFQLVFCECFSPIYQSTVLKRLSALNVNYTEISEPPPSVDALTQSLVTLSRDHSAVQFLSFGAWLSAHETEPLLQRINQLRERIASACSGVLVVWLQPNQTNALIEQAPDFWAWRSAVFDFDFRSELSPSVSYEFVNHNLSAKKARLEEIQNYLDAGKTPTALLIEAASIKVQMGELSEAEGLLRQAIAQSLESDDRVLEAESRGLIADILQTRGELDEALRIRREDELPVFEGLGDVRSMAITQGQIADILGARGELDEALRIRREDELPVFEGLGDVREMAITQGKIADILGARGELDEALRIRREDQLPVFEGLGDVRSIAVTQGQIADILGERGELDEALRIRREDELPVFEGLGDVRSMAITQGRIADILQARGELDEALRIRREDQLPVYKRLGDVREMAMTQGKIADILQARGELDEALRIRQEDELPVYKRLGDVRSTAITQGKIADILQARGELDEGIRIRQTEALPVLERLGDKRSVLVGRANLCQAYWRRDRGDDRRRARSLLEQSFQAAFDMRLAPEVGQLLGLASAMSIGPTSLLESAELDADARAFVLAVLQSMVARQPE